MLKQRRGEVIDYTSASFHKDPDKSIRKVAILKTKTLRLAEAQVVLALEGAVALALSCYFPR